ncbi:MAG: BLUF domain-containing protein [Sphingomonas sp.]
MQRLLYISTARKILETRELEAILCSSRRNNAVADVTGLLVVGGRRFLQMLEGPDVAVQGVFDRIARDPRHFALVTLSRKQVETRLTPNWAMGFQALGAHAGAKASLPDLVSAMVEEIDDPAIRAEFTQFAVRHAAAA